jgi:hypothetical protein
MYSTRTIPRILVAYPSRAQNEGPHITFAGYSPYVNHAQRGSNTPAPTATAVTVPPTQLIACQYPSQGAHVNGMYALLRTHCVGRGDWERGVSNPPEYRNLGGLCRLRRLWHGQDTNGAMHSPEITLWRVAGVQYGRFILSSPIRRRCLSGSLTETAYQGYIQHRRHLSGAVYICRWTWCFSGMCEPVRRCCFPGSITSGPHVETN